MLKLRSKLPSILNRLEIASAEASVICARIKRLSRDRKHKVVSADHIPVIDNFRH